jgi:hypothetical protein
VTQTLESSDGKKVFKSIDIGRGDVRWCVHYGTLVWILRTSSAGELIYSIWQACKFVIATDDTKMYFQNPFYYSSPMTGCM